MGLPKAAKMDTILAIIDKLTKYSHLFPLKHLFIVREVVLLFVCKIVKLHGHTRLVAIN